LTLVPIVIAAFGAAVSFTAFAFMTQWETRAASAEFERDCHDLTRAIERSLEAQELVLEAMRSYIHTANTVERRGFGKFVAPFLKRVPGIQALEWIPRVPHASRAEYERRACDDGLANFRITERRGQGVMLPASEREEYYPVYFVEPLAGNEVAVGFDLASNPERLAALHAARDSGESTATTRITLVQETGEQSGFLRFLPVFERRDSHAAEPHGRQLRGFALGAFRVGDIVDDALSHLRPRAITLKIHDTSAGDGEPLLPETPDVAVGKTVVSITEILLVGGRRWQLVFGAQPNYIASHRSVAKWGVLSAALALTMMVAAQLFQTSRRRDQAEQMVRDRTRELHESEERYRTVADLSSDFVYWRQCDGTAVYVSPACETVTGYSAEELLHTPRLIDEMVHPDDRALWNSHNCDACNDDTAAVFEFRIVTKQGNMRWLRHGCRPVHDDRGDSLGVRASNTDITDRRTAEEQLRSSSAQLRATNLELAAHKGQLEAQHQELQTTNIELQASQAAAEKANNTKSEFLANMSHEIRTPLTAVTGYADLLSRSIGRLPGEHGQWVGQIRQNADHLVSLINDILDLSKIEAGQMQLSLEDSDILSVIAEVDAMLRPTAGEKLLQFTVHYGRVLPEKIRTDPLRLRQMLINLVSNAIKFTDQGSITITAGCTEADPTGQRHLRLSVEDTGIGIAVDDLETIFQPFDQGRPENSGGRGGTGLGLDISRRLARLLSGDISVQSEPGVGSTFTLELPLADDVKLKGTGEVELAAAREGRQAHARVPVDLKTTRILIVDDNPDNQVIIAFVLEEAGAAVGHANDGADGVKAVIDAAEENTPYNLVLMDMRMPVMDGYTATLKLREKNIDVPIIALTAHAMAGDEEKCLAAGCNAYVSKPVVPERLLGEVMRQLQGIEEPAFPRPPIEPPPLISNMADNPRFAPRLRKYVEGMPEVVDQLEAAHSTNDTEVLCSLVHRLHGTAASYGFPEITEVAGSCEEVLRQDGTLGDIQELFKRLAVLLNAASAGLLADGVDTCPKARET